MLSVGLLAIALGLIIRNQVAIGKVTSENRNLATAKEEMNQLVQENKQIPEWRALSLEAEQIQQQNHDLPKLRSEIHLLRERAREFNLVRAENERLRLLQNKPTTTNSAPVRSPDFIPRASFHDAGLGTPEATIQTAFWAMSHGNLERWSECLVEGADRLQQDRDWQRKKAAEEMKSFTGFQIAGKKIISPTEVELQLQAVVGGTTLPVRLKLIDHEWKWDN